MKETTFICLIPRYDIRYAIILEFMEKYEIEFSGTRMNTGDVRLSFKLQDVSTSPTEVLHVDRLYDDVMEIKKVQE